MNKFKLSLITLSCALALTACSSSSGGSDNSEQLRNTETALTKRIVDLSQQVRNAQAQVQNSQTNYNEAKKRSEDSEAQVVKLNLEIATLKKAQAELALAQAEQGKVNDEQLQKLKDDLEQANQAVETANKAAEDLNAKVAKEQKEREETAKRLKDLENLQADQKARIPLSDRGFGGVDGVMKDGVSGGLMSQTETGYALDRTLVRLDDDGINQISVVDSTGRVRSIAIAPPESYARKSAKYIRATGQRYSDLSNTDAFKSTAFGTYEDILSGKKYIYAHGLPTDVKQMPATGIVKYEGSAVYIKDGVSFDKQSGVNATADFANKTIDIQIEESKNWRGDKVEVPEMKFGGKITGNSFAGEVNGIKTQGGFFGENAKELSGVYTNDADQSRGVYGAIKQE